jgi:SAM-dependent methyltransferase
LEKYTVTEMPPHASYEYSTAKELTDEELIDTCTFYFEGEAPKYDEFDRQVERRNLYLQAVNSYAVRKISDLEQCDLILSFGCGTGRREIEITQRMHHSPEAVGIERSPAMGAIAASRGLRIISELGAGSPTPSSVDAVLCLHSFGHLPSMSARMKTLLGLVESLKTGGMLIMDVFNLNDKFEWNATLTDGGSMQKSISVAEGSGDVLYKRMGQDASSFLHYFTLGEIAGMFETSGLVISELVAVGNGHQPGLIGVPLDEGCLLFICTKR